MLCKECIQVASFLLCLLFYPQRIEWENGPAHSQGMILLTSNILFSKTLFSSLLEISRCRLRCAFRCCHPWDGWITSIQWSHLNSSILLIADFYWIIVYVNHFMSWGRLLGKYSASNRHRRTHYKVSTAGTASDLFTQIYLGYKSE